MRAVEVEGGWLLRLEAGEKLSESLARFCRERGIPAATVTGLGALSDIALGYFDVATKTYDRTELAGSWELLNLTGNVAEREGATFPHLHAVFSGPDFAVRGGHLFEGTVSVTAELRLWPIAKPIRRLADPTVGLHLLDL